MLTINDNLWRYYKQERMVMNTEKEEKDFLISAFETLDSNNYGYSINQMGEKLMKIFL